jgi:hypothetical protein
VPAIAAASDNPEPPRSKPRARRSTKAAPQPDPSQTASAVSDEDLLPGGPSVPTTEEPADPGD